MLTFIFLFCKIFSLLRHFYLMKKKIKGILLQVDLTKMPKGDFQCVKPFVLDILSERKTLVRTKLTSGLYNSKVIEHR